MVWKLWLDDVRNPEVFLTSFYEQDFRVEKYVWAMTVDQAIYYTKLHGAPNFMALDHDLGYDPSLMRTRTAMEYLHWLVNRYPDSCPKYRCHSSNPEAAKNMVAFMESWKKSLESGNDP